MLSFTCMFMDNYKVYYKDYIHTPHYPLQRNETRTRILREYNYVLSFNMWICHNQPVLMEDNVYQTWYHIKKFSSEMRMEIREEECLEEEDWEEED